MCILNFASIALVQNYNRSNTCLFSSFFVNWPKNCMFGISKCFWVMSSKCLGIFFVPVTWSPFQSLYLQNSWNPSVLTQNNAWASATFALLIGIWYHRFYHFGSKLLMLRRAYAKLCPCTTYFRFLVISETCKYTNVSLHFTLPAGS